MKAPHFTMPITFPLRLALYIAGAVILAFGITLNTKTFLGVSPIITMPYCISVLTKLPLGALTFTFYTFFIFLQFLLLRKDFELIRVCQIFMSFITSVFIQLFDIILPDFRGLPLRLLMLSMAVILTGIGAALTVNMRIFPNPADGLAEVLGKKCGKDFGFGKNLFDFISIALSAVIGLLFRHQLIGIGPGTILSMIFTGRVAALMQKPLNRLMGG